MSYEVLNISADNLSKPHFLSFYYENPASLSSESEISESSS